MLNENTAIELMRGIMDPRVSRNIVESGLMTSVSVEGDSVNVILDAKDKPTADLAAVRDTVERRLAAQPGVVRATVVLTADTPIPETQSGVGQVRAIVAVASGKGGVGKSTVAVNLAAALAAEGHATGLLDADIYGPSLPTMLGLSDRPGSENGKIVPLDVRGLKALSIGLMIDPEKALAWRGPMVSGALMQMVNDAVWGPLDILVLDLPPGTGDIQLTLAQRVPLSGAVIVSTPQDLALADARRGAAMFAQTKVPVIGLVENMSMFICPHCGEQSEIFGHGGARAEAERLGIPYLGALPLDIDVRRQGDVGLPIVWEKPGHPASRAFKNLAGAVVRSAGLGEA